MKKSIFIKILHHTGLHIDIFLNTVKYTQLFTTHTLHKSVKQITTKKTIQKGVLPKVCSLSFVDDESCRLHAMRDTQTDKKSDSHAWTKGSVPNDII